MTTPSNRLLRFYLGSHPDDKGRMLAEILRQDDEWFEVTHDFIQWLFPLADVSGANPNAPLVDHMTRDAFRGDPILQRHLRASLVRMLAFLGLRIDANMAIGPAVNWTARKQEWFSQDTHNSLRITRMIKSLHLLGLAGESEALQRAVLMLCKSESGCGINDRTLIFWRSALEQS